MSGRTLLVDATRAEEVRQLRMQEYARATGFRLDLSTLGWSPSDEQSFVLALEDRGKLTATMRAELIDDLSLLERKLECSWSFPLRLAFPVLLLSRAATLSSHRHLGLNLVLRYRALELARHHALPFVVGTFVAGSPRENTLREMGYAFFENPDGWQQSSYRSERPVHVVALDMRMRGTRALQYCLERVGDRIQDHPYAGELPGLRRVSTL